jgi:PAS domain S-box-containing protein
MIAAVGWYYLRERTAVETDAIHQLTAVAAIKTAQVENWRAERLGDGRVVAVSPLARQAGRILMGGAATETDRADFMAVFQALEHEFLYTGAALVDLEGRILVGSNVSPGESPRLKGFAAAAHGARDVILTDLYRETPVSGPIRMAVAVPVADSGAIILKIDTSRFLYPYLESWPFASRTAENFLARPKGGYLEYLSELRRSPGSALNLRRPLPITRIPDDRELDAGWVFKGLDYRGVPTIATVRHIRGSDWYLSAKIDDDEVYAPLSRLCWELSLIVALIAISVAAGVGYMWRNQQVRAYRERKAIAGHFDSLTRYANDIILLLDDSGRIIEANQRAAQAYGYSEGELQILDIQALAAAPREAPTNPAADEAAGVRFEAVHSRKDGTTFPVDVSSRLIEVDGTRFRQSIIRDISERVRTEEQIKALSARLMNAQEEERARLARELHDDLSQQIAALSIGMSHLTRQLSADQTDARDQSGRIQQRLVQVSESIRRLSHDLHPAALEHSGLGAAIRGCSVEFSLLTNIRVSCEIQGSFEGVSAGVALCVYRITQEALQNIAKHARVTEAEVELNRTNGLLSLTVSDHGTGMELNRVSMQAGLGLVSIRERTRLVNGTFEICSQPNQGTRLSVRIPG